MMYAYDINLFSKAQLSLASMFEYAVNACRTSLEDYYFLFLSSPVSNGFERGKYEVIVGRSGIELAREVLAGWGQGTHSFSEGNFPDPIYPIPRSQEYWLGWSLAHYQWTSNLPFSKITENVSIRQIQDMYPKYHEMDITQFDEALDRMRLDAKTMSSLKRLRQYAGLSQSELAAITDIPLRTIQQYEQRNKDLSKASVDYCIRLSKALHCDIEMLLER